MLMSHEQLIYIFSQLCFGKSNIYLVGHPVNHRDDFGQLFRQLYSSSDTSCVQEAAADLCLSYFIYP